MILLGNVNCNKDQKIQRYVVISYPAFFGGPIFQKQKSVKFSVQLRRRFPSEIAIPPPPLGGPKKFKNQSNFSITQKGPSYDAGWKSMAAMP